MATANKPKTITMTGSAPKYEEVELQRRQQGYHSMYHQTSQCMEIVRATIPYDFLNQVNEKCQSGYVIARKQPITTLPLDYSVYLIKPLHMQEVDLLEIDARIKAEYIAEIEAGRTAFKGLLRQQLLQKAELAEQKRLDDKRAKLLAEVDKEVNDAYADLVYPD